MLQTERSLLSRLTRGFASSEFAIDLGTSNIRIYQKGRGIVVNEPAVIAYIPISPSLRRIQAVGLEAHRKLGKTPAHIELSRPLKEGVVADSDFTEAMMRHFLDRLRGRGPGTRPLLVVSLPYSVTAVEKQAVLQAARALGARHVHLVAEPMAAAVGIGLPVLKPHGHLLVDIGGGTTEVALISLGGVVDCQSVRVGGDRMDEQIQTYIKDRYNLAIGEATAEQIKIRLGTALPDHDIQTAEVRGLDQLTGLPKAIQVTSREIGLSLSGSLELISEALFEMLARIPPELAADVVNDGITLTGGGSLLAHLDAWLERKLGLPVRCAENPLYSVAIGGGKALEDRRILEAIALS